MRQEIKYIAIARRWFDKINGNTYHSVRITRISDNAVCVAPFQYGYGDHYRTTALKTMFNAGWLDSAQEDKLYLWERENNYPIFWDCTDGLKRDCVSNGRL